MAKTDKTNPAILPVETVLPDLQQALSAFGSAVLEAAPGAGKTTVVPVRLAESTWLEGRRIVILQPRRIAARAVASRISEIMGDTLGGLSGYRMAFDTKVSPRTKIEVITEGVLSRLIRDDPELPGIGLVIFDEFHERSLHSDMGLSLILDIKESLRPDLRILVMSATMDTGAVSRLLRGAPVIKAEGRTHPVEIRWVHPSHEADFWQSPGNFLRFTVGHIREAIGSGARSILVFLPGRREIRIVRETLEAENPVVSVHSGGPTGFEILTVTGGMESSDYARLFRESGVPGRVVLSTSVAETSITIPGVDMVIDTGLVRLNRFDTRTGMDRLVTERISRAAADQRAGRAGRTSAGRCTRLWPKEERLSSFLVPEIERSDLSGLALEAAYWGHKNRESLRFLTPPKTDLWILATEELSMIGAVTRNADGAILITDHGKEMSKLPMHPRFAHMILSPPKIEGTDLADIRATGFAIAAAALEERGSFTDILYRLAAGQQKVQSSQSKASRPATYISRSPVVAASEIRTGAESEPGEADGEQAERRFVQWNRSFGPWGAIIPELAGPMLTIAFPDRVAKRESQFLYRLASGRKAVLKTGNRDIAPEWIVALEAEASEPYAVIRYAVPVADSFVRQIAAELKPEVLWEGMRARIVFRRSIFRIPLDERPAAPSEYDPELLLGSFANRIRTSGTEILPWNSASSALRARMAYAYRAWTERVAPEMPDVSEPALLRTLESWLLPYCSIRSGVFVDEAALLSALSELLDRKQRAWIDAEVPSHLRTPAGTVKQLAYDGESSGRGPVLAVRIQEIFGMRTQPVIAGKPIVLHLLSPAGRPLQITEDLQSFWNTTYADIRKEMRGRYPRHYWPDDPYQAEPTARAKPRT